jgi:hypothetical protein
MKLYFCYFNIVIPSLGSLGQGDICYQAESVNKEMPKQTVLSLSFAVNMARFGNINSAEFTQGSCLFFFLKNEILCTKHIIVLLCCLALVRALYLIRQHNRRTVPSREDNIRTNEKQWYTKN